MPIRAKEVLAYWPVILCQKNTGTHLLGATDANKADSFMLKVILRRLGYLFCQLTTRSSRHSKGLFSVVSLNFTFGLIDT